MTALYFLPNFPFVPQCWLRVGPSVSPPWVHTRSDAGSFQNASLDGGPQSEDTVAAREGGLLGRRPDGEERPVRPWNRHMRFRGGSEGSERTGRRGSPSARDQPGKLTRAYVTGSASQFLDTGQESLSCIRSRMPDTGLRDPGPLGPYFPSENCFLSQMTQGRKSVSENVGIPRP